MDKKEGNDSVGRLPGGGNRRRVVDSWIAKCRGDRIGGCSQCLGNGKWGEFGIPSTKGGEPLNA